MSSSELEKELDEFKKEVKLLCSLQKQYTFDLKDYQKWKIDIRNRQTCCGKFTYYILGKIVATVWIVKLGIALKNIFYPYYKTRSNFKNLKWILQIVGLYRE